MARIRCFLLKPTGRVAIKLRRYSPTSRTSPTKQGCPLAGYHDASVRIEDEQAVYGDPAHPDYITNGCEGVLQRDDPRWPTRCSCGYVFAEEDEWQRFTELIYVCEDTGESTTLRDVPPGAMWYAPWIDQFHVPQGPHCLCVKTPGGEWNIDGHANNCGLPDDTKQERHHCWRYHGEPPDVTVDKQGGPTCNAGGGSIQCGTYHGFLTDGFLVD